MKILNELIQNVRLKTACYFVKKNVDDILSSKVHCIEISNLLEDGRVCIEYSSKPIKLLGYYEKELEISWRDSLQKGRKFFSGVISNWLNTGYELVDEDGLLAMMTGRDATDIKEDSPQETLFLDGVFLMQMDRFRSQIKINAHVKKSDKIFLSANNFVMTFPDAVSLEQAWRHRIEQYTCNMHCKIVEKSFLESQYQLIEQETGHRPLVFAEDKKVRADHAPEKKEYFEAKDQSEGESVNVFPNNAFTYILRDWGYSFCYFAGAPVLDISEDDEIIRTRGDILVGSGDWGGLR